MLSFLASSDGVNVPLKISPLAWAWGLVRVDFAR